MLFIINYTKLFLWSFIYYFYRTDTIFDIIFKNINDCGCIAIKFTQWILPKLEMVHNLDPKKDKWFSKLEQFYEYNEIHNTEYTKKIYYNDFNHNFDDDYIFDSIIGSGSIGQVYKITNKHTRKNYALKVIHPNIEYQIIFIKYLILFIQYIPFINNYLKYYIPIDIYQFIIDFKNQTNMIKESNNCLQFYENYKHNQFIVIPKIHKVSNNIIIMSYENGTRFDNLQCNDYMKFKCIQLLQIFLKNNQIITNFNHGDIHKGNWKIKIHENNPYLIIYDYGFCWEIPYQDKYMLDLIEDTFMKLDNNNHKNYREELIRICNFILNKKCSHKIINDELNKYQLITDPLILLKIIINIAKNEKIILDSILLQILIYMNQFIKYLEDYGLIRNEDNIKDGFITYEYYRKRLVDIYCLCKTHHIFIKYQKFIETKINSIEINDPFETIDLEYDFENIKKFL